MMPRLAIMVALGLAGVSFWLAAAPLIERVFGPPAAAASSPVSAAATVEAQAVELGHVLDFTPFGRAESVAEVVLPDRTEADLVLLGITVAQEQGRSRAIIAGGDGPTQNFGIGESIRTGVVLTGVLGDHVTITWGGQEQILSFQPGNPGQPAKPTAFALSAALARPHFADDDTMLGRFRAEIVQDAPGLLARLGLEVAEGGYLVTDAMADEVAMAGLQPGDLLSAVDGQPLGDIDTDLTRFDQVAAAGTANLSVVRDGATLLMTFPLK